MVSDSDRAWNIIGNDQQARYYLNYLNVDSSNFRSFYDGYLRSVDFSYTAYMVFFRNKWGIDKAFQERFPNATGINRNSSARVYDIKEFDFLNPKGSAIQILSDISQRYPHDYNIPDYFYDSIDLLKTGKIGEGEFLNHFRNLGYPTEWLAWREIQITNEFSANNQLLAPPTQTLLAPPTKTLTLPPAKQVVSPQEKVRSETPQQIIQTETKVSSVITIIIIGIIAVVLIAVLLILRRRA